MEIWVDKLLTWYAKNKRNLPWRKNRDPYAIWISEVMLQQTRVDTVIGYYDRWMTHFPDIQSLAEADPQSVLKQWEGLGYYSRARHLQKAAQIIMAEEEGRFPSSYEQILRLPGIGPYTAGAIASIVFGQPQPAVDGNVLRVISRIFALPEIDKRETQQEISRIVKLHFPIDQTGEFTQSLMELGAMVCLPRLPVCASCPVNSHCRAYEQNMQENLPLRKAKSGLKKVKQQIVVIKNADTILVHQRPATGLLASMWEFPGVEGSRKRDLADRFFAAFGIKLKIGQHILDAKHVFTHRIWEMKVYQAWLDNDDGLAEQADFKWVNRDELEQLPIPTAFQKIKSVIIHDMDQQKHCS